MPRKKKNTLLEVTETNNTKKYTFNVSNTSIKKYQDLQKKITEYNDNKENEMQINVGLDQQMATLFDELVDSATTELSNFLDKNRNDSRKNSTVNGAATQSLNP